MHTSHGSTLPKFGRKRRFRFPWQDTYKEIERDQVQGLLAKGKELGVRGPEQSEFLPLASQQDLDEFQSFQDLRINGNVAEPKLAGELIKLKKSGSQFFNASKLYSKQIGAYGAYNALTGQLGIGPLRVVFSQGVPGESVTVSSRAELHRASQAADFVVDLVKNTPEAHKARRRELLFQAALDPEAELSSPELAVRAADGLKQSDWPKDGTDLGVSSALFGSFEQVHKRGKLIQEIAGKTSARGRKRLRNIGSVSALYKACLADDQSDLAFFCHAVQATPAIDRSYVTRSLGKILFPQGLPEAKDEPLSEEVNRIRKLTEFSTEKSADQMVLLLSAMESPKSKLGNLVKGAGSFIPPDVANRDQKIENFYRTVLESEANQRQTAQVALELSNSKKNPEESSWRKTQTGLALLEAALESDSAQEFARKSLGDCHSWDRDLLSRKLLRKLFPKRQALVDELMRFSDGEKAQLEASVLSQTALENESIKDSATLAKTALEQLPQQVAQHERRTLIRNLEKMAAKSLAQQDPRARYLIQLSEEHDSDGQLKFSWSTRTTLLESTKDQRLSKPEIFELAASKLEGRERTFETVLLAKFLLPELSEKVDLLTLYSSRQDRARHKSLLLDSLLGPEPRSTGELLRRATASLGNSDWAQSLKTSLYESVGKAVADEHPRVKVAQQASRDERGYRSISKSSTIDLFQAALDPNLSQADFDRKVAAANWSKSAEQSQTKDDLPASNPDPRSAAFVSSFSEEKFQQKDRELWDQALQQNSNSQDPLALAQAAARLDSWGERSSTKLRLYENLLKAYRGSSDRHRSVYKLLQARDRSGKLKLRFDDTRSSLIEAAFDQRLSPKQFQLKVIQNAHSSERDQLLQDILFEFYPERAKMLKTLTQHSSDDHRDRHLGILSATAIDAEKLESPEETVKTAVKTLLKSYSSNREREMSQLFRLAALQKAATNERARFLVGMADEREADGDFELTYPRNSAILYEAALFSEVDDKAIFQFANQLSGKAEYSVRKDIAQKYFPKKHAQAESITQFANSKERQEFRDTMLTAAILEPAEKTDRELLDLARPRYSTGLATYNEVRAKYLNSSEPRPWLAHTILQQGPRRWDWRTKNALRLLSADPNLSNEEFIKKAVEESDWGDRSALLCALGEELLPDKIRLADSLVKHVKRDEKDKHWQLMFRASLSKPPEQALGEFVLRSTQSWNSSARLGAYQSALEKLGQTDYEAKFVLKAIGFHNPEESVVPNSALLICEAALRGLAPLDILEMVEQRVHPNDRDKLASKIGSRVLADPKLNAPTDIIRQAEAGQYTASEIREIMETLQAKSKPKEVVEDIELEDDFLVIGDETLEVDL